MRAHFDTALGRTLTVCCILAFAMSGTVSAQVPVGRVSADSMRVWMTRAHVPGVEVGYIEAGKVVETRAFGEVRPGVPLTTDAFFNVASLTKPVTAATALRLVNAGALSLDEPVARYWTDPEIAGNPWTLELTPRLLLSHQSGFANWRRLMPDKKLGFLFEPGAKYSYSGEGFEYLRRVLDRKFGTSLQKLADSLVFSPARMHETTYGWNPAADSMRFAMGHDTAGAVIYSDKRTTAEPNAADWLVTTIGDYSRFGAYVLNGAGISPAVFAEMKKPQVQFPGSASEAMGLGWEIMKRPVGDDPILLHSGSDDGIKTMIVLLPRSHRGIVVFTSGDGGMSVVLDVLRTSLHLKELTP